MARIIARLEKDMLRKISLTTLGIVILLLAFLIFSKESGIQYAKIQKSYMTDSRLDEISNTAFSTLRDYLMIPSTDGNEPKAVEFIAEILKKEGIPYTVYHPKDSKNKPTLVATLPGKSSEGGIILINHTDVVPAEASEWDEPPFGGVVKDGVLYGRGAIDMKGLGIMQLAVFLELHRKQVELQHPVMFFAVADEERGGRKGAEFMITEHKDLFQGYKYAWNEGGIGSLDIAVKGSKVFNLQHAEKGILWLKLKAKGESGHGSTPPTQYANSDLIEFLTDLQKHFSPIRITDAVSSFFYEMGEISPFPNSFVLQRSRNPLLKPILEGVIKTNRHLRAMTSNTVSVTNLHSEYFAINVIPAESSGTIDVRILPGEDDRKVLAQIQAIGKKHNVEIIEDRTDPPSESPVDTEFFSIIAGVAKSKVPEAIVTPFLSPGGTDSAFFRRIGVDCYGIVPALFSSEQIDGIHGKNENITKDQVKMAISILYDSLMEYETRSR